MSQNHRFDQLDALRAFAVSLVVWSHTVGPTFGVGKYRIAGYHGVLLFFVISGFLITGILLDSRAAVARGAATWGEVLRAFYIRRFLRIFPVYYAVLFLAFLVGVTAVRAEFGWHVTYLSNWLFADRGVWSNPTAPLWSLAVEEQFYLVWPWFALLLPAAAVRWTIGVMILMGPLSRLALASAGVNNLAVWITTPTVLDALGLGCLLAYLWRETNLADRVARWVVAFAVLWEVGERAVPWLDRYGVFTLTSWTLFFMWLVHQAARGFPGWIGQILRSRPLSYVGRISYGVYLFHMFVLAGLRTCLRELSLDLPWLTDSGKRQFVAVWLISVAAAALSSRFFEQPINALKDRFPYVSSAQPPRDEAHGAADAMA